MPQVASFETLSPPVSDQAISDALSAWLAALDLAPPSIPLSQAADYCVSLCKLFSQFAPNHISNRDYFIPSNVSDANATRQRRYNTRRLARSLADWFHLQKRSSSPVPAGSTATSHPKPPINLAPDAAESLLTFADAAEIEEVEGSAALLALGEVLLCAAVHSEKKDEYIKAVLRLPTAHQDALAASIRRTTTEEREPAVLGPVHVSNENISPNRSANAQMLSQKSLREDGLTPPRGVPLADYKALATERDSLRRKLATAEAEKNKYMDDADALRNSLEEAGDRVRDLNVMVEQKEADVKAKAKALSDVKDALRDAHVSAEEIDVLRAKAASADHLGASLKRASRRLEEVADMRRQYKELEQQLDAYRESELRLSKHAEYIESQLKSSNDRATHLAAISDNMSSTLEEREAQVSLLQDEVKGLKEKLDTANSQLASMIMQPSSVAQTDDFTTTYTVPSINKSGGSPGGSAESPSDTKNSQRGDEAKKTNESTVLVESSNETPQFDEEVVCNHLYAELGVRMSWDDIVECIRGVMDALREMDEMDGQENTSDITFMNEQPHQAQDDSEFVESSGMDVSLRTDKSEESHLDLVSDTDSKVGVLPDFSVLDSECAAKHSGKGDEFDFAANEVNVREIPAGSNEQEMARRSSSQLPTIPENREAFNTDDSEIADESSFSEDYSTQSSSEEADETLNATLDPEIYAKGSEDLVTTFDTTTDSNTASMKRPDSPMILENGEAAILLEKAVKRMSARLQKSKAVRSGYNSLPSNVRRATSLTVSVLNGIRRTPSSSETRALVRQARAELQSLQNAMNAMRAERQASASIGVLIQQLTDVREEMRAAHTLAAEKEAEGNEVRKELNILMKEFDSLVIAKRMAEERESTVLKEKERLVMVLQESLSCKNEELKDARNEITKIQKDREALEEIQTSTKEKLHAVEVISKAQEVEVARLSARVEAGEMMSVRLSAAVNKNDGLKNQMSRERESYMQDMAMAARREKELAEEARDEARRVAERHVSVLNDVKATAAAAAMARAREAERGIAHRKSTRFGDFWRRLLNRDKVAGDNSTPPLGVDNPTMSDSERKVSRDIGK